MKVPNNTTITYQTTFECGYLSDPDEDTSTQALTLNCHRYQIIVTVKSLDKVDSSNRVINFNWLKKIVDNNLPNNAWLYSDEDQSSVLRTGVVKSLIGLGVKTEFCNFTISCESLAMDLAKRIQADLEYHFSLVKVVEVKLKENPNVFTTVVPSQK